MLRTSTGFVYEIGDRVILLKDHPDDNPDLFVGCEGTVCNEDLGEDGGWISVRWDDEIAGGHNCDGGCDTGYGWSVPRGYIEPYADNEIDEADIACVADICSLIGA